MLARSDDDCGCGVVVIGFLLLVSFFVVQTPPPSIEGDFQRIEYGVHTFNVSSCVQPRLILGQDADVAFRVDGSPSARRRLRGGHSGGHSGGHGGGHASGHASHHASSLAARTAHMRMTRHVAITTASYYTLMIHGRAMNLDRRVFVLDHVTVCPDDNGTTVRRLELNVSNGWASRDPYLLFALLPMDG